MLSCGRGKSLRSGSFLFLIQIFRRSNGALMIVVCSLMSMWGSQRGGFPGALPMGVPVAEMHWARHEAAMWTGMRAREMLCGQLVILSYF